MPPRQRRKAPEKSDRSTSSTSSMADASGLRVGGSNSWSLRTQWIFFAVASGACAAFNGVFAKLTTTQLTSTLSNKIAELFGLSAFEKGVEVVVRGIFFVLNLTFNGIMWTLFTTALARGTSTTQVSIMNTSTNFVLTAMLGLLIFSEALPPLWWAGAAMLVAGNVIVGRHDETKDEAAAAAGVYEPIRQDEIQAEAEAEARKDDEDEDVIDLGDLSSERDR